MEEMDANLMDHCHHEDDDEEEEYVLLDLEAISGQFDIPPNAPYVLMGLDTPEPVLIIDGKWKLIGKYEDTIGTCLVFSDNEVAPVAQEKTGPSEANLLAGKCIVDRNQASSKQVKPVAQLQKTLKFRLLLDDNIEDAADKTNTANL